MDIQNNRQKSRWLLTGHTNEAGLFLLWRPFARIKFSPILITAALSVLIFLSAIGWRATRTIQTSNAGSFTGTGIVSTVPNNRTYGSDAVATSSDLPAEASAQAGPNDFSHTENDVFGQLLGTYVALKNAGTYTDEKGASIANNIAEATVAPVSYKTVTAADIKADSDTSSDRVRVYRDDVQTAIAPLLLNSESELGIFSDYVQTRDKHNLEILGDAAARYHKTVVSLSVLTVPEDAVDYHLGVTNALLEFATTLDALIKNADDPMATLALLRTYNTAEQNVYISFNALASYEKRKMP